MSTKDKDKASVPAKHEETAQMPAFMKGKAKGLENIGAGDMEMPRIALMQGISPELQVYDGLAAGMFWHTLAERSLGTEVEVVPLHVSKRYVLWRPRKPIDDGGILARADDAVHWVPPNQEFEVKIDKKGTKVKWRTADTVERSGLAAWGTYDPSDPKSPPAATLCYVIPVALPKFLDLSPVVLLLQRSAIKPVQRWQGKMAMSQAPIYGTRYLMRSVVQTGPGGDFQNYMFVSNGFVNDQELFSRFEAMHEGFNAAGVKVKMTDDAQPEDPGSTKPAVDPAAAGEKRF